MFLLGKKGFTRLELALGLCVTAGVMLVVLPIVWRGTGQDRPRSAVHRAENLAAAVLDYRAETGRWPDASGGSLDVACLTRSPAVAAASAGTTPLTGAAMSMTSSGDDGSARPWLKEIPVDPWGRPFRVHLAAAAAGEPAVAVVSAGPDGIFQTDSGRVVRGFAGDDVGIVLIDQTEGGNRP